MTAETLEAVVTAIAFVLAVVQPVPQVRRILRTRTAAGVSPTSAVLGTVVNAAWVAYGMGRGFPLVIVISAAYTLGWALIWVLVLRLGHRDGIGAGLVVGGALVAVTAGLGFTALGTLLATAVGVQFLPQVVQAWRDHDLSGLAPGTYLVCAADGLIWGGYGVVQADGPLMLYGVVMLSVATAVVVPWVRWRRRSVVALAPAP